MDMSTAALTKIAQDQTGWGRAARALLKLDNEADRKAAYTEGTIYGNRNPGWRMASAVELIVNRFLSGDKRTPETLWNQELIREEEAARHRESLAAARAVRSRGTTRGRHSADLEWPA